MAMNTVSGNTSSITAMATSVFGNARQAFKAMADAAVSPDAATEAQAAAATAGKGRRGTILDRYV
ncbi:hypothetical protein GCM10010168_31970 [Actinoplanes ianthinogenes]|uniref:Uncharacterized protein n=1 Tax=Actinoplanes ianthinogenes TaxID=122358 RepID=A0ABM7LM45_9ACTN|nr:hypothetical protein [Actinoplanes ianthinogenes]BCJ40338.1 hypothetical protein Aiant_09950 [Actinoplanes ianthinogenes]GGR11567.1 hypothetical protein GCM10010168_31970 [Actinoplanes ianthinogenes]